VQVAFTKMEGLGNDFVVIDDTAGRIELTPERVRGLTDRHLGVGCDQLLVAGPGRDGADLSVRIFNADGSEAAHCGNGMRCLALFARAGGLASADTVSIAAPAGPVRARVNGDGLVSVEMGVPRLEPAAVPFLAPARAPSYSLRVDSQTVRLAAISMGNPHAVIRVDDVHGAPVAALGPRIQRHERFPDGANVGFVQVTARDRVRLRVYERGAGETRACGTGACAAVVAGRVQGWLDAEVDVDVPGGRLRVRWAGEGEPAWLIGPGRRVFEGSIELP